jgi:hypothetical protein
MKDEEFPYEIEGYFEGGDWVLIYWTNSTEYHHEKHFKTEEYLNIEVEKLLNGEPIKLEDNYNKYVFPIRFTCVHQIRPTYNLK